MAVPCGSPTLEWSFNYGLLSVCASKTWIRRNLVQITSRKIFTKKKAWVMVSAACTSWTNTWLDNIPICLTTWLKSQSATNLRQKCTKLWLWEAWSLYLPQCGHYTYRSFVSSGIELSIIKFSSQAQLWILVYIPCYFGLFIHFLQILCSNVSASYISK
jgi:hypothetical protein